MGDSDDEYDRRRRDKFRKERSDYQDRRDDRGRREEWIDSRRESWGRDRNNRREYRDSYDPRRRDRYSPPRHDLSPPMKRMRRNDWDDRGYPGYDMGYGAGGMMGAHQNWGPPHDMNAMRGQHGYGAPGGGQRTEQDIGPTQPPMMTFKLFLTSQDDTIGDEEAVRKYNEYKLDFRRQQLNDFFLNHKEEEWFKSKYHPEDFVKKQNEQEVALKRRLNVFMEIQEKVRPDGITIDADKADEVVKLLDSVVIKLEGGSDFDLKILDSDFEEIEKPEKLEPFILSSKDEPPPRKEREKINDDPSKPLRLTISSEQQELQKKAEEFLKKGGDRKLKDEKKRKRNKIHNFDGEESGSESESCSSEPDTGAEPLPPGMEESVSNDEFPKSENSRDADAEEPPAVVEEPPKGVSPEPKEDEEGTEEKAEEKADIPSNAASPAENENEVGKDKENGEEELVEKEPEIPKPRPLHRTCSIFLRNLAPTITKQEIEVMCKRYPGYLRVSIADPQPERHFFRRGWVSFERGVNIKEICWNLNNIRLRECELGAIVNRDLTRRIRTVNGITSHKQVVRADIKTAAKIIQNIDGRYSLWEDEQHELESNIPSFGLISKNPLLKNITDYLIEEANAEEEELLGTSDSDEKKEGDGLETTVERDDTLITVLDKLLLYLRIVHSVDYYNHSDYPNEDEMPNRCGIMHARGSQPGSKVTQQEITEYINAFEQKIAPFLQPVIKLSMEEATKLGKKDPDVEVEKFVQANTQELAKDKWLCPLSGKKFKGPEFVRKHIFNKHGEKVEEVKKEVEYFNNYLLDLKRPQLPEHPGNKAHQPNALMIGRGESFGMHPPGYIPAQPYAYAGFNPGARMHLGGPPMYPGKGGAMFGGPNYAARNFGDNYRSGGSYYSKRGRGRNDSRELIQYRDLDAPNDVEIV